jgi:hypothetical protein
MASQDSNTPVIVIARLGDRERAQSLSWKRLATVRDYLLYGANLKNKLVLATGERTKGHGCIEVYIAGKLCFRFGVHRNRNVPVSDA